MSPENLDKDKLAVTFSHQVRRPTAEREVHSTLTHWHGLPREFTEHQEFYKVQQDVVWEKTASDPGIQPKN